MGMICHLVPLSFALVSCWSKEELPRRACLLGRRASLGNIFSTISSSLFKFLFLIYSIALELECSIEHDRSNAHELEPSSSEHCSSCSSLFFIVHMFYKSRGDDRERVKVYSAFGLALVLARPSIGWESAGDRSSSLVCGRGVRMRGNLQI